MEAPQRKYYLWSKYGITPEEYATMYRAQGGRCLICGVDEKALGRKLAVDHDESTGEVRGLLCGKCNLGIGFFNHNPTLLVLAALYLDHETRDFAESFRVNLVESRESNRGIIDSLNPSRTHLG